MLAKGIKTKDVGMVQKALKSGATLEATDSEFHITLYFVARLEVFAYKPVSDLIEEARKKEVFGLQQSQFNRELQRKTATNVLNNNNNNNIGSDAGSGNEHQVAVEENAVEEDAREATSFGQPANNATESSDIGYQADTAQEHSTIFFDEDDEVDFGELALSQSYPSASANKY